MDKYTIVSPLQCQFFRILCLMLEGDIRGFLKAHGLKLNKDLGQHFLIDEAVLGSIIGAARLQPTDHVVEIGPGIGILTAELLRKAKSVTTIELDKRMIPLLKTYIAIAFKQDAHIDPKKLTIEHGNALRATLPNHPYKVVANIPYHITSPLLRLIFLQSPVAATSLTLLLQREVAEKICDTEDAGLLTILVGLFGTAKLITRVPPESFLPPPEVDSAVVHIDCFAKPKAEPVVLEEIFKLTKIAFSGKRKMLRNTLGSLPEGQKVMDETGIANDRRPQTLSIDEWIALAQASLKQ